MSTQYREEIRKFAITVGRGLNAYIAVHDQTILHAEHAFTYAATYGGKPWCYALVALNIVAENMTLAVFLRAL